jgi:photosystem II stability/assembly factor-like uncharacterized protein
MVQLPKPMKITYLTLAVVLVGGLFISVDRGLAQVWTGTSAPTSVDWLALASSADGTKLVAAADYPTWGIYVSADSGATWTETAQLFADTLTSSADGTKLAATQGNNGFIFTSTNSGATWTQTSAPQMNWYYLAGSTNGNTLAAAGQLSGAGPLQIFVSHDSGGTWTGANAPVTNWNCLASSADGTRLVAANGGNGSFFTSVDSGGTWTQQTNQPSIWWSGVASSADGIKLAAVTTAAGGIYTSTNGGTNWAQTSAPLGDWYRIASSADGTKLVAAANSGFGAGAPGPMYLSNDSGTTWTSNNLPEEYWTSVASSADGSKFVACSSHTVSTTNGAVAVDQIVTSTPHIWMSMAVSAPNVTVIWPWPAAGYGLEQNLDITSTNWVAVTNQPVVTNFQNQVILPLSGAKCFYRLEANGATSNVRLR